MRTSRSVSRVRCWLLLGLALSCARGPAAIAYGHENCDVCRMVISDPRFGAELVTVKGKHYTFDSIECLADFYRQAAAAGDVHAVWVSDFQHPGTFLPAERAQYVRNIARTRSPMGRGLAALSSTADVAAVARSLGGQPATWADVLALADSALRPAPATAAVPARAPLGAATLVVEAGTPSGTIAAAIARAHAGDRIVLRAGVYHEPTIVVNKRLTIEGEGDVVLDGDAKRQIMTVAADDVTIRHLHFRDVGVSYMDDLAAVKVLAVRNCLIENNVVENAFFGIYLAGSSGCRVLHNDVRGRARDEANSGNGIHLWQVRNSTIAGNHVTGHRDGLYFEFVQGTDVRDNLSERNLRYGLHFMYSDDCTYEHNTFRRNLAGVAVMYTHRVTMVANRFEDNWGGASYGLLFKEIVDSRVERNQFVGNTVGLVADGANRLVAVGNEFRGNGWAVKLLSNTEDGRFEHNRFIGNTFDVSMSGGQTSTTFVGNYWDHYRGYDLNHDGVGDVAFRPVRLFSLLVAQNPPALILLRSPFIDLLDAAERVVPALTPRTLVDRRPAMSPLP